MNKQASPAGEGPAYGGWPWLLLLIPGLYLSDILFGIFHTLAINPGVTPGQLTRGMALILALYTVFRLRARLSLSLKSLLLACCFFAVSGTICSDLFPGNLLHDISPAAKVIYGPFLAVLFAAIIGRYRISATQLLLSIEVAFYLLGLSLLLMYIFGIGQQTYGDYAFGHKGVFYSQNDIGLSAAITLAAALYAYLDRGGIVRLFLIAASMSGVACMGTRTGMIAPALVSLALVVVFLSSGAFWRAQAQNRRTNLVRCVIVLLLGCAVSTTVFNIALSDEYQRMKMDRTLVGEMYRSERLRIGRLHVEERPAIADFLGEGALAYRAGVSRHKEGVGSGDLISVEMDWFDLFGQYGIVLSILLHLFYGYALLFCLYLFARTRQFLWGTFALMLGLYLSHSLIAGHAMVSPISSTPIAAIIGFILLRHSQRQQNPGML